MGLFGGYLGVIWGLFGGYLGVIVVDDITKIGII